MSDIILVCILCIVVSSVFGQSTVNKCSTQCDTMKLDHLTLEMCRDAKKILPRPKVGDFCSNAMEQGYSDACMDLCMGKIPVSRQAQSCRHASMEMPRPTVRRWCEHGYAQGFGVTRRALATYFVDQAVESQRAAEDEAAKAAEEAEARSARKLVATIPITLDDKVVDLKLHEGESAEEAVVSFCQEWLGDDVAGCIRELLPTVMTRIDDNAQSRATKAAASSETAEKEEKEEEGAGADEAEHEGA